MLVLVASGLVWWEVAKMKRERKELLVKHET